MSFISYNSLAPVGLILVIFKYFHIIVVHFRSFVKDIVEPASPILHVSGVFSTSLSSSMVDIYLGSVKSDSCHRFLCFKLSIWLRPFWILQIIVEVLNSLPDVLQFVVKPGDDVLPNVFFSLELFTGKRTEELATSDFLDVGFDEDFNLIFHIFETKTNQLTFINLFGIFNKIFQLFFSCFHQTFNIFFQQFSILHGTSDMN